MNAIRSLLLLLTCMSVCQLTYAQNWEYINLRQYRAKDISIVEKFVKHAYPFFNKSKLAVAVNRISATGESGRIYAATYFSTYEQFTNFLKDRNTNWEEYTKSPGNVAEEFSKNLDNGPDDSVWKLNKDLTHVPDGVDPTKMQWRKLLFVTIKVGMMSEYEATWKKIVEVEKKAGINYPVFILNATYGMPTNTVLISLPAENAGDYYSKFAVRQKIREANPEIIELRKKLASLSSNTIIDHITVIPY